MKRILAIACTGMMLMGLNACQQIVEDDIQAGKAVTFSVATGYEPETRTSFSGDISGTSSSHERIDWVANDVFRVYSPQAATDADAHVADYSVKSVTADGGSSVASVTSTNPLLWATGTNEFYAFYPAPTSGNGASMNNNAYTGRIPAVQTVTAKSANVFVADMANRGYMYAYASGNAIEGSASLEFLPLMTAFEFKIHTSTIFPMRGKLTTVKLKSTQTNNSYLAGDFTATLSSEGTYGLSVANNSNRSNTITVTLPNGGVNLSTTTDITITLLGLPMPQSQLTLELTSDDGKSHSLPLQDAGSWITVPAGQKMYVNNLAVPGTIQYDMATIPDISITGVAVLDEAYRTVTVNTEKDTDPGYTGANRDLYKTAWKAYYVDGSKPQPTKGTVITGNADYSTTPPSWIKVEEGGSGAGKNDSFKFLLHGSKIEGAKVIPGNSAKAMIEKLKNTNLGIVDLSRYRFMKEEGITDKFYPTAQTANCYIINGYGTFLIPLVYGNAYKDGRSNPNAYSWNAATQSNTYLRTFINSDGNPISSPFILDDLNRPDQTTYNGCVVWQDTQKSFEILKDSDIEFLGSKPSNGAINCAYLQFTIKPENIKPGNLVIALRDNNNQILWSWHIWIRADITVSDSAAAAAGDRASVKNDDADRLHLQGIIMHDNVEGWKNVNILSQPLGWTPPISYEGGTAAAKSYWVAIVSTETQAVIGSFKISKGSHYQTEYDFESKIYSAPYFQWGRKDPFLPTNGVAKNKAVTSAHYTIVIENPDPNNPVTNIITHEGMTGAFPAMLAYCIKNPHIFNSNGNGVFTYHNLWDGNSVLTSNWESHDEIVQKTVYDPSPRGFTVPRRNVMTGGTSDGGNILYSVYYSASDNNRSNLEWPAGRMITDNHTNDVNSYKIFMPSIGWRGWGDGNVNYSYVTDQWGTGDQMFYWTASSVNISEPNANAIHGAGDQFHPQYAIRKTDGFPIIPQQEQ